MVIELLESDKVDEVRTVAEVDEVGVILKGTDFDEDDLVKVLYLVRGKRKGPCSLSKLW